MENNHVITRFAPSPTGNLHIGGARTALFNYLWAKKNNGIFILRIEDTDRTRYKPESEKSIIEGLKWLGLNWDKGPIRQSDNFKNYRNYAEQLVKQGKAYYCFCTAERLEKMREIQKKKNLAPKYDGACKRLKPEEIMQKIKNNEPYVIRLKVPEQGSVVVDDLIRGKIKFDCREIDDQVLIKSDGFPTYHLANVVDDHEMGITYVIRGEEWIPSTPKHILIYQAFGWLLPKFAHLSLFINKGGGKLSKREGAASLLTYRDEGYLPEAVNNFIAFLGWNPKDKREFFLLDELIKEFDLKNINKANPIFDTDKLDYINGYYLRQKNIEEFTKIASRYLPKSYQIDKAYLQKILKLEQGRVKKLSELPNLIAYFFTDELKYDKTLLIWKNLSSEKIKNNLEFLAKKLNTVSEWETKELENIIISWIKEQKLTNGEVLWPMRVALTGEKSSPSPFEVASVLNKDKTLQRIQNAINLL
jgi:glutamyl-tRNA synthetase